MKKIIVWLFFFCSLTFVTNSQVTQQWTARYNGPGNSSDYGLAMAIDASGNVYVTGESTGSSSGYDYVTIKYNNNGVQQWIQTYNGPGNSNDAAVSMVMDASGNVYVTGQSTGSGTGYDYATIKYNPAGAVQWIARYDGPSSGNDLGEAVALDAAGNVYVTGCSANTITGQDYATVKYNPAGVQQWVQRYHGPGGGFDYSFAIAVDAAGNVHVTGYSYGSFTGSDAVTIKYNTAGVQQWIARFDGNGSGNPYDGARAITLDPAGNVYITGESQGVGTGGDLVIVKYNSSGIQQWVRRYDGQGSGDPYDSGISIAVDIEGNVYVTGRSPGAGTGNDFVTLKYNPLGTPEWVRRYNGPASSDDAALFLALDNSCNVYVTGESKGIGSGFDYVIIKYNSAGAQQWIQRYDGTGQGDDCAYVIAVDNSGNVYVTGASTGSSSSEDYLTIKYSQPVSAEMISLQLPEKYDLSQNYPNPFNPVTNIKFDIPAPPQPLPKGEGRMYNSNVRLIVYDILGREVATLVNQRLKPGSYVVEWNGSDFASGIYFYSLQTEQFTETKKMVLMK